MTDSTISANPVPPPPPRKSRKYTRTSREAHTTSARDQAKIARAKTPEEKEVARKELKLRYARRNHTNKINQLKSALKELLPEHLEQAVVPEELVQFKQELLDPLRDTDKVIIRPHPGPQTEFLAANEDEVFYGGARGGGKSYSLILDPLRYINHPRFTGLLIRRTVPELQDIIAQQHVIYKAIDPKATFLKQEKLWTFSSGARLFLGYGENVEELERYRGHSYQWLGVDELPQFPTPDAYNLLKSSVRSPYPDLKTSIRATGNPGSAGSGWVKEMFIDPAPPKQRFTIDVKFKNPLTGEEQQSQITRKFIPARVWDNPTLLNDSNYVSSLASLPETMRKQMLEGDWDISEGMAFSEFRRAVHVCEPFAVPYEWPRFRCADWGYQQQFAVYWVAIDPNNVAYVYREYYGNLTLADQWAYNVCAMEAEDAALINYGIIDRSTAANRGDIGPSVYETIMKIMRDKGHPLWRLADQSPNSRMQGKQELHRRLAVVPLGRKDSEGNIIEGPRLKIFDNCTNLIRTLPMLPVDKNNPEVVDTDSEDHAYDALRYGLMSRPVSVEQNIRNRFYRQTEQYAPVDSVFGY